jgi:hypothetical protein
VGSGGKLPPDIARRQFVVGPSIADVGLVAGCGRLPVAGASACIGYLPAGSATDPVNVQHQEAFRDRLRELGYVEGQHLIESHYAPRQRRPDQANELARLPVDIIVVGSGSATRATMSITTAIPIAVLFSGDMVRLEVVASHARPGGNVISFPFTASWMASGCNCSRRR